MSSAPLKPIPTTAGSTGKVAGGSTGSPSTASARAQLHTLSKEGKEEFKKLMEDFERRRGESLAAVKALFEP